MHKNIIIALALLGALILIVGIARVYTVAGDTTGSGTSTTTVDVANVAPTVDSINFSTTQYGSDNLTSSGILPNVGANRTIYVTGVVSDANGETDIASTSVVFRRSNYGASCIADKNTCYRVTSCDLNSAYGTDTEVQFSCTLALAYWIDATDASSRYAGMNWQATVVATDQILATGTSNDSVEVNSLLALNIPESINYGTRALGEQTSSSTNQETTLTQKGNSAVDVELSGTAMACSVLGSIPVGSQRWSLGDNGYASSSNDLTGSGVEAGRNIGYRTSETLDLTRTVFWDIVIPASGVKGTCTGLNTISIVALTPAEVIETAKLFDAGYGHSLAIQAAGTLWGWGSNGNGQVGDGTITSPQTSPVQAGSDTDWIYIAGGVNHSFGIQSDGTLWAWGSNANGRTGFDTTTGNTLSPTQVGSSTDWSQADAGGAGLNGGHSLGIRSDGSLYTWGRNNQGQLGFGDTTERTVPTRLGSNTWVTAVAGPEHTLAIRSDGTLWGWGRNNTGQVGIGNTTSPQSSPVQVGASSTWAVIAAGGVGGLTGGFSLGILSDGTLWSWGQNSQGQLGLGDTSGRTSPERVGTSTLWIKIAAGITHTAGLRSDGTLWTWGSPSNGQLGNGTSTGSNVTSPAQVGTSTDWVAVSAGNSFSLALKSDGTLWGWGLNTTGELGQGNTTSPQTTPIQIGTLSIVRADTDNRLALDNLGERLIAGTQEAAVSDALDTLGGIRSWITALALHLV